MYVHVHRLRVHAEEDEVRRSEPLGDKFLVRLHHRLVQVGAAEIASANEEILVSEGLAGAFRASDETVYTDHRGIGGDVNHFAHHVPAKQIHDSELQRLGLLQHVDLAAVVGQRERNVGTRDRHAGELLNDMLELNLVRLEELAASRGVVEEVADGEIGPDGSRYGSGLDRLEAARGDLGARFVRGTARPERYLGDGRDTRKRLTAEAVGHYAFQVCGGADLGRRVPLEAKHGIRGAHAGAVVYDLDEGASGVRYHHVHLRRTCVHRVLHQFLDNGRGALYHLSGGNHVGYPGGQYLEASHYSIA